MNEYKLPDDNNTQEKPEQTTEYTWQNPSPYNTNGYTGNTAQYTGTQKPKKEKKERRKLTGVEKTLIVVCSVMAVVVAVFGITLASFLSDGVKLPSADIGHTQTDDNKDNAPNTNVPNLQAQQPAVDGALSTPAIYEKVKDSVVGIIVTSTSGGQIGQGSGTGIILSEDGYISTNAHVVEGATTVKVVLNDESEYNAQIVGIDAKTDLAVLKVDAKNLVPAEIGDSDKLVQGETVVAIGNPYGLELQGTITQGIVSALNRQMVIENVYMTLIQTDAAINPGNSGGPLVNVYGQVIGITSSKIVTTGYEGIGFAIPMTGATDIIEELIQYGYVKDRPSIGIYGSNIDSTYAKFYSIPEGVYVEYVDPTSDAHKKGLKKGDIITAVNGTKISSMADLDAHKNKFKPGDSITLSVFRNTKTIEITVVLSETTSE